jgi:hypothetical protein
VLSVPQKGNKFRPGFQRKTGNGELRMKLGAASGSVMPQEAEEYLVSFEPL